MVNKKVPCIKVKGVSMPQNWNEVATFGCYNHTKFHTSPLDGYGEIATNDLYTHVYCVTTFTVHVHFEWGNAKMLVTPQLKELPRPKLGFVLPLSGAITIPIFIRFRQTAMEK